jgi:HlyD family secretion protein
MTELNLTPSSTHDPAIEKSTTIVQQPVTENIPSPKSQPQWLGIALGLGAIAIIGVGSWYIFRPQTQNAIAFSGRIEGYETDVSTKSSGRVEEVTVREGDNVTKGQLLVRLDDAEIRAELQAASSQVVAAQKRVLEAELQISVVENQLADASLGVLQSEGDSQGKIAEAKGLISTAEAFVAQEQARVEEAKALLEQTRVDRDRYAQLAKEGAETAQRYDLAKTAYNTALAAVNSREKAVEAARQSVAVARGKLQQAQTTALNPDRQSTQVARLQVQSDQARSLLAVAQADVKTAEANRQLIQSRLNNLTVNSPINGVVTVRSIELGTVVLPTRPLLRIVDLKSVYMRGFIPEGDIGKIRVGQSALVFLDADRDRKNPLKATVTAIDAKASFTPENVYFKRDRTQQVFGVKLAIDDSNGFAKIGMPVDAEIELK